MDKNNKNKIRILRMKDSTDNSTIKKKQIFDAPMRLGIVGGSGSGKTSILSLLLLDPLKQFYRDLFLPENIFIFSGSLKTDNKIHSLVKALQIPQSNLFDDYNDSVILSIYEMIEDRIAQTKGKKDHSLFIFDDLSFSKNIRNKRNNALGKLYLNGRKNLVSTIFVAQKYNQIPPDVRINLSGLILYSVPTSELEMVVNDHNFLHTKKEFYTMFRDNVKERFHFMVINYSNDFNNLYLDKEFNSINPEKR